MQMQMKLVILSKTGRDYGLGTRDYTASIRIITRTALLWAVVISMPTALRLAAGSPRIRISRART